MMTLGVQMIKDSKRKRVRHTWTKKEMSMAKWRAMTAGMKEMSSTKLGIVENASFSQI